MPRLLSDTLWLYRPFTTLPLTAQMHFVRWLLLTDDYGAGPADPAVLKALIYRREPIDHAEIAKRHDACVHAGLITLYTARTDDPRTDGDQFSNLDFDDPKLPWHQKLRPERRKHYYPGPHQAAAPPPDMIDELSSAAPAENNPQINPEGENASSRSPRDCAEDPAATAISHGATEPRRQDFLAAPECELVFDRVAAIPVGAESSAASVEKEAKAILQHYVETIRIGRPDPSLPRARATVAMLIRGGLPTNDLLRAHERYADHLEEEKRPKHMRPQARNYYRDQTYTQFLQEAPASSLSPHPSSSQEPPPLRASESPCEEKTAVHPPTWPKFTKKQTLRAHQTWAKALKTLKKIIDSENYDIWINTIVPLGHKNRTLHLAAPSPFNRSWLNRNFLHQINAALKIGGSGPADLDIHVKEG